MVYCFLYRKYTGADGVRRRGIYGNHIEEICEVCRYGRRAADGENLLCVHKGVMSRYEHCRKFEYDPLRRIPTRAPLPEEHTAEEFSLEE